MGGHSYSSTDRTLRATRLGYFTKERSEIFESKNLDNKMNPFDVKFRESRDSEVHPNSLAIIIGLDETGSMGTVPHYLVREGLPHMINNLFEAGIADPAIMFMGIGDHLYDEAPLQIGQFESGDELLDEWLTKIYLECGGGGNNGESYMLAWYFAAMHTSIDCFEKRKQKGFLFTIGDEPVHPSVSEAFLKRTIGSGEFREFTSVELYEEASKLYNVFHIHIKQTSMGSRVETVNGWREMIADNLLIAENQEDVSKIISDTIIKNSNIATASTGMATPDVDLKEELIL